MSKTQTPARAECPECGSHDASIVSSKGDRIKLECHHCRITYYMWRDALTEEEWESYC